MRHRRHLALLVAASLTAGCGLFDILGESDSDSADGGDSDGGEGGSVTDGGGEGGSVTDGNHESGGSHGTPTTTGIEMTGADNDPELGCPCAAGTELIYVLSDGGSLWSFDPKTASFDFIADIACGGLQNTYSMGVSRKGRAWIQYWDGDLYTVDLNDPSDPVSCLDPGFMPGHPMFPQFGMAFVGNGLNDPCDKLYIHSGIEPGLIGPGVGALGVIDPYTLELSTIAPIDYAWGELTGTGSGRLFAFQGSAPAILTEYDKLTGEVLDTLALPGLHSDGSFAFAWWAGDFYLFTADIDATTSQVWHLDHDDSDDSGQALTLRGEAPIQIVGAGVSTCAPPGPM